MIRLVVADDHTVVRQGIVALLNRQNDFDVVGEAGDAARAIAIIEQAVPDVAVVDLRMPGGGASEVLAALRARGLPTRVVVLTMNTEAASAARAIRTGAFGYVLKDCAIDDLVYAIRTAANGGTFISPSVAAATIRTSGSPEVAVHLTSRQREVLALIAAGLTNREIGERLAISIKTVETHRAGLMDALDLHTIADLVRYAIDHDIG